MERTFDVAIIGSGSAGTNAATALRKGGRTVAVIDERPFGGTCALRGCDPKKVLVAAARALDQAESYAGFGIFRSAPVLDWPALMRFKRTFTEPAPQQRERQYEQAGIVAVHGQAKFIDEGTLSVGDDRIRAAHFIIATGAKELHVAEGDDCLLTAESFLELPQLPKSLLSIGGGYIAFELAHVAACAGSHVSILNDSDKPLHGFDPELVDRLLKLTRDAGIEIHLETRVESAQRTEHGVVLKAHTKGGPRRFEAENAVLAAGRVPDLDALDLQAAGIERSKKGVKVDRYMQSVTNPRVYAAGDAADGGGLPLTPVAAYEGAVAAANILNEKSQSLEFRGLVSMVYSLPALGSVGLSEEQAREAGIDVEVHSGDMSDWYSTRHLGARAAFYKCLVEKRTGKIAGAAVLGPNAEEQLNVLALAIRYGLTKDQIAGTLFAYPTASSDLEYFVT
jgi:glutathione reductase (NADPH)